MINNDTVNLLKECNAGIQMGVSAIDEVLPKVESQKLETLLNDYKNKHSQLGNETNKLIQEWGTETKEPNPVAKGMSWMKTNMKLAWDESDATISDLITDGCNMGVKSIRRYMNQYDSADERTKNIAKKLIDIEQELAIEISPYL